MTTTRIDTAIGLRLAAEHALLAPSVHNTQPWRFVLRRTELDVRVDRTRRLRVLDPTGRQLLLSIGCAIFNARASLAAAGVPVVIEYFPEPADIDVVARLRCTGADHPESSIAHLEPFIPRRQTNRRRFTSDEVPADVVSRLITAAAAEGAVLTVVESAEDRLALARLTQRADTTQVTDPAYRAELREWTSGDSSRRDGVPARVVPHVDGTAGDDIPIRDFDTSGQGWLPAETHSSAQQCLLILGTALDEPAYWVRAGQALERVWLEITAAGFVASVFTQPIEVAAVRVQLQEQLRLDAHPDVVLRVGRAPLTPATSRRRSADVVRDETRTWDKR